MTKLEKDILSYWHDNWYADWETTFQYFVKKGHSTDTVKSTMERLDLPRD